MSQSYGMLNCYGSCSVSVGRPQWMSTRMTLSPAQEPMQVARNNEELRLRATFTVQHKPVEGLYAMNGGDGPHSYAQNSSYQRGVVDVAKPIIQEEITTKLDIEQLSSTSQYHFRIADFGCSTGHNSFPAIQIIIEAIEKKIERERRKFEIPDYQVYFNDQVMNDFNTLFASLPPERQYSAAGVPGPFQDRLLPKASLHFAYSSCALNWLSEVPKAVQDRTSCAWNEGKVHYMGAKKEVFDAYSNQYEKDITSFLNARAIEVVSGGLMALLVPAVPTFGHSETTYTTPTEIALLGSCLMDMANEGRLSKAKVDSFNFPLYFTIPNELKAIIERNNNFSIERMEILNNPGKHSLRSAKERASYLRAVFEGLLVNHLGSGIMDELFERYANKLEESSHFLDPDNEKSIIIFVLLKRTGNK